MKKYACKHIVEAAQWQDNYATRELFLNWFKEHDATFTVRGTTLVLTDECDEIDQGDWILFSDGQFFTMPDDMFTDCYAEVPQ